MRRPCLVLGWSLLYVSLLLARPAQAEEPADPWIALDALLAAGDEEAAGRSASSEAQRRYVAAQLVRPTEPRARAALERARGVKNLVERARVLAAAPVGDDVTGVGLLIARGATLQLLEKPEEAVAAFEAAAVCAGRLGWRSGSGRALGAGTAVAESAGKIQTALRLATAWARIARQGGGDYEVLAALAALGRAHRRAGELEEALTVGQEALEVAEALRDPKLTAPIYQAHVEDLLRTDAHREALSHAPRALELLRESGDQGAEGRLLLQLARLHEARGDARQVVELLLRAIPLFVATGQRRIEAVARLQLAGALEIVGKQDQATTERTKALDLGAKLGAEASAQLWEQEARFRQGIGDLRGHRDAYRRAMKALAPLAAGLAHVRIQRRLARAEGQFGNYPVALDLAEAALRAAETLDATADVAGTLEILGRIREELGEFDRAHELYGRALGLRRELGQPAGLRSALHGIGNVAYRLGRYPASVAAFREKIQLGSDESNDPSSLMGLGLGLQKLGKHREAEDTFARAAEIYETKADKAGVVHALLGLSGLRRDQRRYREARWQAERALLLARAAKSRSLSVGSLYAVATAEWALGAHDLAVQHARLAAEESTQLVRGLGHQQAASARQHVGHIFQIGIESSLKLGRLEDLVWFLEAERAGALLEAIGTADQLRGSPLPRALQEEERTVRRAESDAHWRLLIARKRRDRKAIMERRQDLREARARVAAVFERIQRIQKGSAALLYPRPASIEDIQRHLARDEALIVYGQTWLRTLAVVLRRASARVVDLGAAREIESAIENLHSDDQEEDPAASADALAALVLGPLKLEEGIKRLIISPTGRLSYVPFPLLSRRHEVIYVPSATALLALTNRATGSGVGVLALGDPAYTLDRSALSRATARRRGRGLVPLPNTRTEVEAIGDVKLLGKDATEHALAAALTMRERWRAVHFACHGLIHPQNPMFSSLALTADPDDPVGDGLLTVIELFRMRMECDLVVLSACNTARGKVYRSEGVVGLVSALFTAGSPAVICSLWKVDDEATQALMIKFYELWNPKDGTKGLGAAAALKKAQRYVRDFKDEDGKQKWKHPYYWAAWVLWGLPD